MVKNQKNRQFAPRFVKALCQEMYKKCISEDTWSNWRSWCGINRGSRAYSFESLCLLAAIAHIRSQQVNKKQPLNPAEVQSLAYSREFQESLSNFIYWFDSRYVMGSDAPQFLALHGLRATLKDLNRWIPLFSASKIYSVDALRFWCNVPEQSSTI